MELKDAATSRRTHPGPSCHPGPPWPILPEADGRNWAKEDARRYCSTPATRGPGEPWTPHPPGKKVKYPICSRWTRGNGPGSHWLLFAGLKMMAENKTTQQYTPLPPSPQKPTQPRTQHTSKESRKGNPNVLSLAIKHSFQRVYSCLEMKQMKATCVNGCRKAIMSSTGNKEIEH